MRISVYRDRESNRELLGEISFERGASGSFSYDAAYLTRGLTRGELGISERLPLDTRAYSSEEFSPFFRGLLPEGAVYANLAQMYQVSRDDYLSIIAQLGCESIGALTFVADGISSEEFTPRYEHLPATAARELSEDPLRAVTHATSETRLSLSGAQSKVAWYLPEGVRAKDADKEDWLVPRGTAPSSHIVKISAPGEQSIALNELACSCIARACKIQTARVDLIPFLPGAIAVKRYDRAWVGRDGARKIARLHQEDFCQALGLAPYLKYQPGGTQCSYPLLAGNLIDDTSENPRRDRLEFAKRLAFNFAIGNSDAHFKNSSLLYNPAWTARSLSPMYDVTCIHLTGYSTRMAFDIGAHRELGEINERDIMAVALDLDLGLTEFDQALHEIIDGFSSPDLDELPPDGQEMAGRILDNSRERIGVLRNYMGA